MLSVRLEKPVIYALHAFLHKILQRFRCNFSNVSMTEDGLKCVFHGVTLCRLKTKQKNFAHSLGKSNQRLSVTKRRPSFVSLPYGPHSASIAFRHLPPNSARIGYATAWSTLYLCAAVSRRGQRPPKGVGTNKTVNATQCQSTYINMRRVRHRLKKKKKVWEREKKKFRLHSNDLSFICACASNVDSIKRNA